MSDPKPTRREFNKFLAALPLTAAPVAKAAATPVPEPTPPISTDSPDVLRMADMVAQAVARRPLRLYARDPHRVWLAARQSDFRERLSGYSWARKAIKGPGPVVELQDHPLIEAMRMERRIGGGLLHIEHAAMDLTLTGSAYLLSEADRFGTPARFWPVPSHIVSERLPTKDAPRGYYVHAEGQVIRYAESEMIGFRLLSVFNPYSPGLVQRGDLRNLKIGTKSKEQIANEFGIPLAMLDAGETRRNADRAEGQFQRNAVDPICRIIASALTRWTHRHPLAASRGWDRLVWAFDEVEARP